MSKDAKTRDGETGGSGGPKDGRGPVHGRPTSTRDGSTGGDPGPKNGALDVKADEIVTGGDPGPKAGRGPVKR